MVDRIVILFFTHLTAVVTTACVVIWKCRELYLKKLDFSNDQGMKMAEFYEVLVRWIKMKTTCGLIEQYLVERDIHSIAVYGMKDLGKLLCDELTDSNVKVVYTIDRAISGSYLGIQIISPNENFGEVDAIIVTAIHYYDDIAKELRKKIDCPIISIEDIVFDIEL